MVNKYAKLDRFVFFIYILTFSKDNNKAIAYISFLCI